MPQTHWPDGEQALGDGAAHRFIVGPQTHAPAITGPASAGYYHRAMSAEAVAALFALFASAFLSATILPGSSEVVLAGLVAGMPDLFWTAIVVATIGNTLGGLTSYAIGRVLPQPRVKSRAIELAQRRGVVILLFSWVPILGDALCVASGWLRQNAVLATLALAAGKLARYVVVAFAVKGVVG
ncbi:MAG TPA: hypothetical protein VNE58_10615 [Casimicrobiaceae bacterium]|nr:hypothetical protein [Casimicrobiaceae bacterium]